MKWTSEKPTKPGYYWLRGADADAQLVRVYRARLSGAMRVESIEGWNDVVDDISCQWAGPLEEPQE